MVICLHMLCASDRAQAVRKTGRQMPHVGFLSTGCCVFLLSARLGDTVRILLFLLVSPSWQPVSLFISFARRYRCQQPSDAARGCPAQSTLTKENVRLLLSVSFFGFIE